MKKIHLLFSLALLLPAISQAQLLQNNSFENWTNGAIWEDPTPYSTSNSIAYILNGAPNVTKTTDFHGGNYAIRLETVSGTAAYATIGNFGASLSNGMAFAHKPDSVVGYAKFNLLNNDTGAMIIVFKKFGSPIGFVQKQISGSLPNYTRFSLPTGLSLLTPDTVLIFMITSLNGNGTPGSFVQLDDVSFVGSNPGNFPDGAFEIWSAFSLEEPDNWTSSNSFTALGGGSLSVDKSTAAYSGTYAAHISTQYSSLFNGLISFLITANFGQNNHMTHELAAQNIRKVVGYYKYTPVGNDTAEAVINFTKSIGGLNVTVDSFAIQLPTASTYTAFQIDIDSILAGAPDSMWIGFTSSNLDGDSTTVHQGSQLWIDDVDFVFPTGIAIPMNEFFSHFTVYPNPSDGNISLSFNLLNEGDIKIHLYNNAGVEIKNYALENLDEGKQNFSPDMDDLNSGVYYFGVESNGKTEMHKFILSR